MNLTWNALIFGLAIAIPGGLVVYFAWKAYKAYKNKKQTRMPTPEEAKAAYCEYFPEIQ